MKIVQAVGWYYPDSIGGTEIYVAELARQLRGCGHEVMVRRPGLFNEAIAGFYRSTEAVARARAEGLPSPAAIARVATAEVELGHPEQEDLAAAGQTDVGWLRTEFTEGDRR